MSICKDFNCAEVCATAADGTAQTLIAHYEYGSDDTGATILVSTRYADAAGVPVDTAALTVTAGACPVAQPSVEFEQLCDVAANGTSTQFMCRVITSFDSSGAPVVPAQVDYFELDKVTPYVVAGTVGDCPECLPATAQGVLTTWGA